MTYLERGGVTGVGFTMVAAGGDTLVPAPVKREDEAEMMGRLAGRGTAPGGRVPRTPGKNGGFEADPIEESAAEAAAAVCWRKYISRGEIPATWAPATKGLG